MAADKKSAVDAKSASTLTGPQLVRLECVSLAYRHDRPAGDVVAKAAELERYVLIGRPAPAKAGNDGQVEQESDPI